MFAGFEGYPDDLAVTATDDTTLEFTLTAPCARTWKTSWRSRPSTRSSSPLWKRLTAGETSPGAWCQNAGFVSNGPFVCTEWNHDVSMTYEKNPYWYGADDVELEKMEFMLSADDTAIYAAYNSGDVDMIDTVPNDEIQSLLTTPSSTLSTTSAPTTLPSTPTALSSPARPRAGCLHAQGHEHL